MGGGGAALGSAAAGPPIRKRKLPAGVQANGSPAIRPRNGSATPAESPGTPA